MSTQETSLPKFSHEDRIRMHLQRRQIREKAKIYTKKNFLQLITLACLYYFTGLFSSALTLTHLSEFYQNLVRFIVATLLFAISRIGIANAILRLWNEQRLKGSDLLIAVSSPKRFGKAIVLSLAESGLAWIISFFPQTWMLIPSFAAQVFAVFFALVPFLYSRNPDANAIDLIKESFRRMYRFFWQWYGVVIRACKWILISTPILLTLSMLAISLITGQRMIAEYLNLGLFLTFIPITLFFIPYYLVATTGFVNDQVLTAGQTEPQAEAVQPV